MRPSTAISMGLVMIGIGSITFAHASDPRWTLAAAGLMVLGAGVALGGALSRWGR